MGAVSFAVNCKKIIEESNEFTAKEKIALLNLIGSKPFPLWNWLEKEKFDEDPSRIVQFLWTAIYFKENAQKELKNANYKLHLKDSIERLIQLRGSLTKSEKLLQKNKKIFSKFNVGSSISRKDRNTFLHIQKGNTNLPVDSVLQSSHRESIEDLSIFLQIMIKATEGQIANKRRTRSVIPAPGKLTGKNAEQLHYCRNLIYQFEQILGRAVSPRVIWNIYQLVYSSETNLDEARIKKLIKRQNISKK